MNTLYTKKRNKTKHFSRSLVCCIPDTTLNQATVPHSNTNKMTQLRLFLVSSMGEITISYVRLLTGDSLCSDLIYKIKTSQSPEFYILLRIYGVTQLSIADRLLNIRLKVNHTHFYKFYIHCFFVTSASVNMASVRIPDPTSRSISLNVCS